MAASNDDDSTPGHGRKRFNVMLLTAPPELPNDVDIDLDNACVIVSPRIALDSTSDDQLEEYTWVDIQLDLPDEKVFQPPNCRHSRTVQVLFNDLIEDENCVYLPPQLWHNLRFQPLRDTLEQVFWQYPLEQPGAQLMIDFSRNDNKHTATTSIQVNLINSPEYPLDYDYSHLLRSYFSTGATRYLRLNDTFAVPTCADPLFVWSNPLHAASSSSHSPVIYFQVCKINDASASLHCDFAVTDISQVKLFKSSNVNCCCPSILASYYHSRSMQPMLASEALRPEVSTLARLIRPYLLRIKSLHTGTFLLSDTNGSGVPKRIVQGAAQFWHLNVYEQSAIDLLCEVTQTTEAKIRHCFAKANLYAPCLVLITDLDILYRSEIYRNNRIIALLRSTIADFSGDGKTWPVMLAATVQQVDASHPLTGLFLHRLNLEPASDNGRQLVLNNLVANRLFSGSPLGDHHQQVRLQELVKLSSGFSVEHLEATVTQTVKSVTLGGGAEKGETFDVFCDALKAKMEHFREQHLTDSGCGLLQVPDVSWSDIGGLEEVKQDILETIEMPLKLGLRFSALGIRRSGILLYGPPGTGKTLLAKAVAAQCALNFISVKGPELINKYVGQSEENVRNLFAQARQSSPSIIFFDELDSLAPARGRSGDSGGVMDRVVSQLLTELDGISGEAEGQKTTGQTEESMVFVIGATNRVDLIDSALLRPGRFDKCLHVPIATDRESRLAILRALTRRFDFEEQVESEVILQKVEEASPPTMSGADFYSLCSSAMFNALRRTIDLVERDRANGKLNTFAADEEEEEREQGDDESRHRIKVRLDDFIQMLPETRDAV